MTKFGSTRRASAGHEGRQGPAPLWRLTAALIAVMLVVVACGPGADQPGQGTPAPGTPAVGTPAVGTPDPGTETPATGTPDPGTETPATGTPDPGTETPAAGTPQPGGIEPPTEAVTLEFWNPFTGPDGQYMSQLVDQFNQEAENVQVNVTAQGEYYTVIRTAAEENTLPHVAVMHVDAIPAHAADGIITPIDDLADQLGLSGDDFTQAVWDGGVWQDQRFAVPLDIHTLSFYWNKELFRQAGLDPESPPTDQDSFMNAARAITEQTGVPGYIQISTNNFLAGIVWATLFYQGGGELTNADGTEATYNSQAGIQAAQFMRSFIDEGISPEGMAGDDEIVAFQQGQSGMVFSGIWETTRYAEALGDDLGAGPVPNIFGEGVWAGSHQLVVPRTTDDANIRQGAYYFIDWISRHSMDWAAAGQIPARNSARQDAAFQELEHISAIGQQADAARFPPAFPAISDLIFAANGAGEAALLVVTGQMEAQQAFDQSAAQYTQFLQENQQRYNY